MQCIGYKTQFYSWKKLIISILVVVLCMFSARVNAHSISQNPNWKPSMASEWWNIALEATAHDVARNRARPTIGSRALGIVGTAMYDAWSAYTEKAVGTRLGGALRRPSSERTLANKQKAISYAAYRALLDVYPQESVYLGSQMRKFGFNPDDDSLDKTSPQGIGNRVAAALIEYRHHDGANQLGDEPGSNGKPYSDYTFYQPINSTDKIKDPDRWQPIPFVDSKGGTIVLGFLTPHWYRVKPFALERPDQFRPPPPPSVASKDLYQQVQQVLEMNANLTAEQKALVEFMRDGPSSTQQAGHWLSFGLSVARRDKHTLDQDIKLFFALCNAAQDAFIASWDAKRAYDSSRPWTLIHHYFAQKPIRAWGGPGKGTIAMSGEEWHPYSPSSFVTPPFPGYVSGHSTVSAACAEILRFFTGSDRFEESVVVKAGALTEPGFEHEVTLAFPTFTSTAEAAGISRLYGGYHIQSDNVEGLKLGRKVAQVVWQKAVSYFEGKEK
jgi:hypothetical protein